MPDRFDYQSLATRLLRGGIAPRRVRRIVGELQDHARSLHADAVAEGMNEADAASWASARLGSEQQVAKEMLARPELRSWSARWPWAVYALMPPLLMAALVVLMVLALGPVIDLYVVHWEWETSPAPLPHAWFMSAVDGTLATFKYVAPLLLCAAFCSMAVLRLSSSPWLIAGIVATAVLGGSFDIYMTWGAELWTTSVNLFLLPPPPAPSRSTSAWLTNSPKSTADAHALSVLVLSPKGWTVRNRLKATGESASSQLRPIVSSFKLPLTATIPGIKSACGAATWLRWKAVSLGDVHRLE